MSQTAATWSAIAAIFSAIAAILLLRIERLSFQHSARPEIVITGWKRDSSADRDKILFSAVENVGVGSALYVHINAHSDTKDGRPMIAMSTIQESLISSSNKVNVNGEMLIWWENVPDYPGGRSVPVNIKIYCWDTTGIRYFTSYSLNIFELPNNTHLINEVAPGVMLGRRSVKTEAVWMLRLKVRLSALPLIGHLIKID